MNLYLYVAELRLVELREQAARHHILQAARSARPAVEIWNLDLRLWPDRPSNALMLPRLSDRTLGHVGNGQGSAHHSSDVPP